MNEGRRGSANFSAQIYKEKNPDLVKVLGDQWIWYYIHYMEYGYKENRPGK